MPWVVKECSCPWKNKCIQEKLPLATWRTRRFAVHRNHSAAKCRFIAKHDTFFVTSIYLKADLSCQGVVLQQPPFLLIKGKYKKSPTGSLKLMWLFVFRSFKIWCMLAFFPSVFRSLPKPLNPAWLWTKYMIFETSNFQFHTKHNTLTSRAPLSGVQHFEKPRKRWHWGDLLHSEHLLSLQCKEILKWVFK